MSTHDTADLDIANESYGYGRAYVVEANEIVALGHCDLEFWNTSVRDWDDHKMREDVAIVTGDLPSEVVIEQLRRLAQILELTLGRTQAKPPVGPELGELVHAGCAANRACHTSSRGEWIGNSSPGNRHIQSR